MTGPSARSPRGDTGSPAARIPWTAPDYWWLSALGAVALLATAFLWVANRPGRMTNDSAHQLQQVFGRIPLDDWHPAIMTVSWTGLYRLTGEISSMVLVQIGLAFLAALLLAVYLHDLTRSRLVSWLALVVPLLPFTITFLGVLWKDVQMMLAFFIGTVLILLAERFPALRYPLLGLALLFLLYGAMVRKNAFFAILPLVFLLYRAWRNGSPKLRTRLTSTRTRLLGGYAAAAVAFLVLLLGAGSAFNAAFQPKPTGQLNQVFLDDIIFTVPARDIRAADLPQELEDKLLHARAVCQADDVIWDAYWKCYGRGATGKSFEPIAYQPEVRDLWLSEVVTHPVRWAYYRAQTYSRFLFVGKSEYAPITAGRHAVPAEYHVAPTKADSILTDYVVELGAKTFPWFFRAWFWLAAAGAIILLLPRAGYLRPQIAALGWSALLYLLGYIPIVPASDFRYSYWPAVACTLAGVLFFADRRLNKKRQQTPAAGVDPAGHSVRDSPVSE
ncbi:hypothetical protein ACMX2H_14690 [Arthrobacter sulfonylureivorans]|uniref:hypothetical protein n=1 Tax=Arthrobacter sulfonylureivorans TaxID=2486855 RepID=UPI0039E5A530